MPSVNGTLGRRLMFNAGGALPPPPISVLQFAHGDVNGGGNPGVTFGNAVTVGSVLVAFCYESNGPGGQVSLNASAPSPADGSWTTYQGPGIYCDSNNGAGMTVQAKVASTSFVGPFYTNAISSGHNAHLAMYEIAGATLTGAQSGSQVNGTASPANAGSFSLLAGDILLFSVMIGQNGDPVLGPGSFTESLDAHTIVPWTWAAYQLIGTAGSIAASATVSSLAGGTTRIGAGAIALTHP